MCKSKQFDLQHRALTHTEQQATKGQKLTSVKQHEQFKRKTKRLIYRKNEKRETFMNHTNKRQ